VNTSNTRAEVIWDASTSALPEWARSRIITALGPVVPPRPVTAGPSCATGNWRWPAIARLRSALEVKPTRADPAHKVLAAPPVEAKRHRGTSSASGATGGAGGIGLSSGLEASS